MEPPRQLVLGKKLNSKQAHTANAKEKAKAVTFVQIDRNSEFALNDVVAKKFSRVQRDYRWILINRSNLIHQYPNKYIAVENQTVRFVADTVEALKVEINGHSEQVEDFAIEYLSSRPRSFLF